jgi:hypothetical protein
VKIINHELINETIEQLKPLLNRYTELSFVEKDELRILSGRLSNFLGYELYDFRINNG